MAYTRSPALHLVFAVALLSAQTPADSGKAIRIGPGVTLPRLTYKVAPEYSAEARANHIQGTVILQIVVNEKGRAAEVTVISPLDS